MTSVVFHLFVNKLNNNRTYLKKNQKKKKKKRQKKNDNCLLNLYFILKTKLSTSLFKGHYQFEILKYMFDKP